MSDTIHFKIGGLQASEHYANYHRTLKGSTWDGQTLKYQNGKYYVNASVYKQFDGLEMIVVSMYIDTNIVISETVFDDDVVVMRAANKCFNFNPERSRIEVGDSRAEGIFLYNNKQANDIFLPKDTHLQLVNARFTLESFENLTRGRLPELKSYLQQMDSILLFQSMTVKMSTTLDKIFKAQEMDFGKHAYSFIHSFELLMNFIEEVQNRAFGEVPNSLSEYDYQRMLMVKELLLANLAEPPQTQELCDRFGLSAQKLRNDFKTMYGVPPYQFVLHQRFEIAYQQLAEGKSSIKELAFDLGFANPNHFNKAFKKHFGVSAGTVKK